MKTKSVYQEVTDKIITALAAGVAPWATQWAGCGSRQARNSITGRPYNGINRLLLMISQLEEGYADSAWMTFNQAKKAGGMVRKGECGTRIVLFSPCIKDEDGKLHKTNENDVAPEELFFYARSFTVFNVAQIDGLAEQEGSMPPPADTANLLDKAGAKVSWGQSPCYRPMFDLINLPTLDQVRAKSGEDAEGVLFATAAHELIHWTGAAHRLDRLDLAAADGETGYAKEELVAELGSAFLCAQHGVAGNLQHAEYIGEWLKELGNDNRFIFQAASKAQAAMDYLNTIMEPSKTVEAA